MRNILVVIDMQNDFIDAALGTKEACAIVPRVLDKMKEYVPEDIYATRDTHPENYLETREGRYLPVAHCIEGSDGWQIRSEIEKLLLKDHIINKPTFGSEKLADLLEAENAKEELDVTFVGLCTDICVVSNALLLHARLPEINISVDSACCAGVTPEKHEAALETMRSCQVNVI